MPGSRLKPLLQQPYPPWIGPARPDIGSTRIVLDWDPGRRPFQAWNIPALRVS